MLTHKGHGPGNVAVPMLQFGQPFFGKGRSWPGQGAGHFQHLPAKAQALTPGLDIGVHLVSQKSLGNSCGISFRLIKFAPIAENKGGAYGIKTAQII